MRSQASRAVRHLAPSGIRRPPVVRRCGWRRLVPAPLVPAPLVPAPLTAVRRSSA